MNTFNSSVPAVPGDMADPRQSAYDAVFALIRGLSEEMPSTTVHRNAVIWRAVHAALDAIPVPAPFADRATVLREAADRIDATDLPDDYVDMFDNGAKWATAELRRLAAE